MEIKERYVDGIGKIHFLGSMIKFDLMSFSPSEDDKNDQPVPKLVERLVMSPNGFLASYEAMVNMIKKLTDAGILSQTNPNEQTEQTQQVEEQQTEETTKTE